MKLLLQAFLFALLAAIGNATFVYGQKKSVAGSNPFIFLLLSLTGTVVLLAITASFFPLSNFKGWLSDNLKPILITSVGIFITYIGFYYLYSRYGASYYIIYAVLSILTTSIIVGVLFFDEKFNLYYLGSICFAILTIVFFFLGQRN